MWIGYTRKDNAKRALVNNFKEGLAYRSLLINEERAIGGTTREVIHLTIDCFKKFCMMTGTAVGEAVRNYFLECERRLFEVKFQPQPQPTTATTPLLDMIEKDLVRLGIGEAFILRWKYSAALRPLSAQSPVL